MSNLERGALELVLIIACATAAYFYAYHNGVIAERKEWEVKQATATKKDLEGLTQAIGFSNQLAQQTAEALAKRKANSVIDRGVIEREIQTNTVYASDCLPASGIVRWNNISAGRPNLPDSTTGLDSGTGVPPRFGPTDNGRQSGNAAIKPPSVTRNVR